MKPRTLRASSWKLMLIVCVDQEVRVVANGADDEHQ